MCKMPFAENDHDFNLLIHKSVVILIPPTKCDSLVVSASGAPPTGYGVLDDLIWLHTFESKGLVLDCVCVCICFVNQFQTSQWGQKKINRIPSLKCSKEFCLKHVVVSPQNRLFANGLHGKVSAWSAMSVKLPLSIKGVGSRSQLLIKCTVVTGLACNTFDK